MNRINKIVFIIILLSICILAGTNYKICHTGNASGTNISGEERTTLTAASGGAISNVVFKRIHRQNYSITHNSQTVTNLNFTYSHTPDNVSQSTDSYGNTISEISLNQQRSEVWVQANYSGQTDISIPAFTVNDLYPLDVSSLSTSITQYLDATTKIQSTNSTLKAKAESIVNDCSTVQEAVEKIAEWMVGNITYSTNTNQDAVSVYNNKTGNCEGYTNLILAFLRSIGIPARFCSGYLLNKSFSVPIWQGGTVTVGGNGPGTHATYQIYYPSISNWVAGDAQGYVNYINTNNIILGHGKEMSDCVESVSFSYTGSMPSVAYSINTTIGSINPCNYSYRNYSTFSGTNTSLILFSTKEASSTGIEDYVNITLAPNYLNQSSSGNIVRAVACDVEPYGNISDLSTCELYGRSIEGDVLLSESCTMYDIINGYWEFEMSVPSLSEWNNTWIRNREENDYIQAYFKVINGSISDVSSVLILSPPTTSGTISKNESWAGTLTLTGNVTISSGVSLYILPGTTVKFNSGKSLNVYGILDAQGTEVAPIFFTSSQISPSAGDWYRIYFGNSSVDASCKVKYCDIKYAQYGIYCNRANPKIQNNSISNSNNGIYLYYSSPAYIETNTITDNSTGIYGVSSSPTISDNLLRDNSYAGIYFSGGSPKFYDNTIDENSMGAYIISGSSPKFGPTSGSGKGNNVITGNSYGIYAQYYSELFMGSHGYYPGERIGGYNSICDNSVRDATAYFYTDIEAEYNWWGTSPVRLASYGSSINYSYALDSDPGGGSSLGKPIVFAEDNSGKESDDRWAGFDPNNPDINSLSGLWLWGHYLFINDKLEEAISVYQMLVTKFSDNNYANRSLVKIYHLYHETGKDGLAGYLNGLLNNSKINKNVHQIIYPLLMNAYLDDKDINSALNIGETIMKKYPDSITEKTAIYNMVLAMLNDLNDIEKASKYTEVLKQKYPDDELTYMAREAMGEKVNWSLDKPVVEPEIADIQLPERYALHNNYPNPFNPQTTIQYQLKAAGNVKLEIYDLTGKLVQTIVDEYKQAGNYTMIWDARNVSSGIYLYRLQTKEFISTKKCIKLK